MDNYLRSTYYMDAEDEAVRDFALRHTAGLDTPKERAIALFYAVRDSIRYNPYKIILRPEYLKASYQASKTEGYCIEKSNLYASAARALGIPSRLGFANVRNHLGTSRLEEILGTDLLVFHGYAELYLGEKWIKVTPVFDAALCKKLGVPPLDFDGETDCFFQASDKNGLPFMEYVEEHGVFDDLPFDKFVANLRLHYGHLFEQRKQTDNMIFDWE
jgi:transglutaminase-like putative cysteine protease